MNCGFNRFAVKDWHGFWSTGLALSVKKVLTPTAGTLEATKFFRVKIIRAIGALGPNPDGFTLGPDGKQFAAFTAFPFATNFCDNFRVAPWTFREGFAVRLCEMLW
jgi:hypothetical protein